MKRLLSLLIVLVLILSLCGCNTQSPAPGNSTPPSSSQTTAKPTTKPNTETNPSTTHPTTQPPAVFEPCEDLIVVASYVYDRYTHIVVENVGEKPILEYTIAYMHFDRNGFLTTSDSRGYKKGSDDSANIMPGSRKHGSWYCYDGEYVVATVSNIKYSDGSSWSASLLDLWATTAKEDFSVSNYKASIAAMASNAKLAEENEYAKITSFHIEHGNRFSNDHDLVFSIKNTSSQGILYLSVYVLQFDENGFPVSVSPYDSLCKNGRETGGTINLAKEKTGNYSNDLFIEPSTPQIKIIVKTIELQDGTRWENPYFYEWLLFNCNDY